MKNQSINEVMISVIKNAQRRYKGYFEKDMETWLSMPEIKDGQCFDVHIYVGSELDAPVRDAVKGLLAPVSSAKVKAWSGYVSALGLDSVALKRLWPVATRLSEECSLEVHTEDGGIRVWHELIPYLMMELY